VQIGDRLSHYRITARLGEGGMGIVYRAEDVRLGRPVALKVLAPQLSHDAVARRRLEVEARAASALDHPNICALYDVGETSDGRFFLALAFCEGETLRQRLDRGPLEPANAAAIGLQIAEGLTEAHAKGIVHRDIKPANVMLRPDGLVKILDFGVARLERDPGVTGPTDSVGSPAYMAPEQISSARVGAAADVWALGVVLFELIAGRRPFEADAVNGVLFAILHQAPPPLERMRPDVDPRLARIVARALAKDPTMRYSSAAAMADDLRAVAGARDDRTRTLERAPAARAGAAQVAPLTDRASDASLAVLPFSDLSPDRDQDWLCEGLAEELINALSAVSGLRVPSRASTHQLRDQDPRTIGEKLGVSTILTGSVRKAGDRLRITTQLVQAADGTVLSSSRYDRSIDDVFAIQDEIARSAVETVEDRLGHSVATPRVRRPTANIEAFHLYLKGRLHFNRRTPTGFREAIRFFEQAVELDPDFALGYAGLADAHAMVGFFGMGSPSEARRRGKEHGLRALALDPDLPEAKRALAILRAIYEWDWRGAEGELRALIAANPSYGEARHALAIYVLAPVARFDEAVAQIEAAIALDPLSLAMNTALGLILLLARRYQQSERQLRATLEIDRTFSLAVAALAETLTELGRFDESIELMHRGFEDTIENRGLLGPHLARAGHHDEARVMLAEIEKVPPGGYVSRVFTSQIHLHLGEVEIALDQMEQAVEEGAPRLVWFGVRPLLDPLREHPRFQRLLERMGLPNVRATAGRS
jgi:serine/threonine-protein kinase